MQELNARYETVREGVHHPCRPELTRGHSCMTAPCVGPRHINFPRPAPRRAASHARARSPPRHNLHACYTQHGPNPPTAPPTCVRVHGAHPRKALHGAWAVQVRWTHPALYGHNQVRARELGVGLVVGGRTGLLVEAAERSHTVASPGGGRGAGG